MLGYSKRSVKIPALESVQIRVYRGDRVLLAAPWTYRALFPTAKPVSLLATEGDTDLHGL